MKSILRIAVVLVILLGIGGGLVWAFLSSRSGQDADDQTEAPIAGYSRISKEGDKTVLTFDAQAQRANGIVVETLRTDRGSTAIEANGLVLQLQPLLDLKSGYNAADLEIAKARAATQASDAESKRLIGLNQGGQNVSDKAVEAARAAAESDAAILKNAQQSLSVLKQSTRLHWGPIIASWLEQGSPQLDELLSQNAYLVQVAPTSSAISKAPLQATLQMPDNNQATARLVSRLPQVDPRLQSPSYLYMTSVHSGLAPGMNVPVSLASGPKRNGVFLPNSAVVWWQGSAWAYVEQSSGKFTRVRVSTVNPTPTGWFVSEGMSPGARVVTAGAQTLLSEESHSQIQVDED